MNKGSSFGLMMMLAMGCGAAPTTVEQLALSAGPDAQALGVYAYEVDENGARLFDQNGVEYGSIAISAPTADRRIIHFDLVTGLRDDLEVYRPKSDGTFFVPADPTAIEGAVVADAALAPLMAAHQMLFRAWEDKRLAPAQDAIADETVATKTVCSGGCSGGAWTCTTPAGCVRSANTSVGCTNPSQLAPTLTDTGANTTFYQNTYNTQNNCTIILTSTCNGLYGAGNYTPLCTLTGSFWTGKCVGRRSVGTWTASCPPMSCTAPNYDAVPRQDTCYDPGSCAFSTGTVTCTTFH